MEIKLKIEVDDRVINGVLSLAALFSQSQVETVKITNPEITKMREAVTKGEELTKAIAEGVAPNTDAPPEETETTLTIDEVRRAFLAKNNAQTRSKLKAILDSLGVDKITDLQPAQFDPAMNALEAI